MMVPGEEQEDEVAVRQYATKASVPSYSDLTARHPPSSPSPALLRQPPKEAAEGRADGELDEEGPRQGAWPRKGRRGQSESRTVFRRSTPSSSLSLSSS